MIATRGNRDALVWQPVKYFIIQSFVTGRRIPFKFLLDYLQRNGVILALTLYRNVHESAPIATERGGDRRETDTKGRDARMLRRTLFGRHVATIFAVHRIWRSRIGWRSSTRSSTTTSTGRIPRPTGTSTTTSTNVVNDRVVGLPQTGS